MLTRTLGSLLLPSARRHSVLGRGDLLGREGLNWHLDGLQLLDLLAVVLEIWLVVAVNFGEVDLLHLSVLRW